MTRKICVVGISGVGKTTFINNLKSEISFQHLSAGSIIKTQRELKNQNPQGRDALRNLDMDENQLLLIDGFNKQLDKSQNIALLDGHTVIDTSDGLQPIPAKVFSELKIDAFLMLQDDPELIQQRRLADSSRQRPQLSAQEIKEHQDFAILATGEISRILAIPLMITSSSSFNDSVISFMKSAN